MSLYTDVLNNLPRTMRLRFESLGSYVRTIVLEAEEDIEPATRLDASRVHMVQLVVLLFALDNLLREGSRAAETAVRQFERLGASGFTVGSALFKQGSDDLSLGTRLSEELRRVIPLDVLELIGSETSVRRLTLTSMRAVRRA